MRQKALCPPARGTLVIAMCNQARMATVLPRTPTRCTRAYAAVSVIRFPRRTPPGPPVHPPSPRSLSLSLPPTPLCLPLIGFVTAASRGHRLTNLRSLFSSSGETRMFLFLRYRG